METTPVYRELFSAYRKYKRHVYYDSYSAIQRVELAQFEDKLEMNLHKLERKIDTTAARAKLLKELIEEIDVICFPKSINSHANSKGFSKVLTNRPVENYQIDRVHYFISLPVEAHILGVLWISKCGCFLDQMMLEHCYGNRLNDSIASRFSSNEEETGDPFLFEPYFKKYESWRDEAIASVTDLLDAKKDAILITLDLMNYYYNSAIDFDQMREDIHEQKGTTQEPLELWLNDFVEEIFIGYHKKFSFTNRNADNPMIPLGFLPSLIVANWNLLSFDLKLTTNILPCYYGRYVDDIMIVLPVLGDKRKIKKNVVLDKTPKDILETYFKCNSEESGSPVPIFRFEKVESKEPEAEVKYDIHINTECFADTDYSLLKMQSTKVKVFVFEHSQSRAILDNFRKEIILNSSEFRLIHEKQELYESLSTKLYHLEYSDTVNKIRSVEGVKVDKFELSKALSWLIAAAVSDSDHESRRNYIKIIEVFRGSSAIEFMLHWEKLLTFLFIEKKSKDMESVVKELRNAIQKITYQDSCDYGYHLKDTDALSCLRLTLGDFLDSTLARVLALRLEIEDDLGSKLGLNLTDNAEKMRILTKSMMLQQRVMKWPLRWPTDNCITYDLINPQQQYEYISFDKQKRPFPRYVHYHEFVLDKLFDIPQDGTLPYLDEAKELYERYNHISLDKNTYHKSFCPAECYDLKNAGCEIDFACPVAEDSAHSVLVVGNGKKEKIKIGLVNTKLKFDDFIDNLKGVPNQSTLRYDHLAAILNEAARKHVEILVMPEVYIPYEWRNIIADFSRQHQIAMVFGMEHIIYDGAINGLKRKYAVNMIATFLPTTTENGYHNCVPILRVKNHYAPDELRRIRQYKLLPYLNRRPYYILFVWNDIYFAPYYCFEIADINDRALFKGCTDIIFASEYNRDANYFANITESLARDLYCYCVQVNTSEYGYNAILAPTKSEQKYQVQLKGGEDDYVVTQTLDIRALREAQIMEYTTNMRDAQIKTRLEFKPQPPGFNNHIVRAKMKLPDYTGD